MWEERTSENVSFFKLGAMLGIENFCPRFILARIVSGVREFFLVF